MILLNCSVSTLPPLPEHLGRGFPGSTLVSADALVPRILHSCSRLHTTSAPVTNCVE